jgi:hypothetical protein
MEYGLWRAMGFPASICYCLWSELMQNCLIYAVYGYCGIPVNQFASAHYISDLLERPVMPLFKAWTHILHMHYLFMYTHNYMFESISQEV